MIRFFDPVSKGLLDAAKPSVIIEVGSDKGPGTERLADWCQQNGAVLHVIDPVPKYDVDEWAARWPGVINFHLDLSLNALREIPPADVVMIDGDHNWYTVFHELELLAGTADEHDRPFPLTLLHDVGWPYGRRDLYYDPESVPEEFRNPYRQSGMVPGQAALDDRGFNAVHFNAVDEGTPRNGVLTAVEDFVESHDGRLALHVITGMNGLAILVDPNAEQAVHDAVAEATGPSGLRRVLAAVEDDRNHRFLALQQAQRSQKRAEREVGHLQARLEQMRRAHARVLNRRAVRASLKVASLARPLFRNHRARRDP